MNVELESAVGFTSRVTAAFRVVEQAECASPIIHDPLAVHLAGSKALQIARNDWRDLVDAQGPGKHLRVPARNRILDDDVMGAVQALVAGDSRIGRGSSRLEGGSLRPRVQIVNLGAGMDSRAWRLPLPPGVAYFEADQEEVVALKRRLLLQAGAQVSGLKLCDPRLSGADGAGVDSDDSSGGGGAVGDDSNAAFPLSAASWAAVGADLSRAQALEEALLPAGFSPALPTLWTAEALLYYMPLPQAQALLRSMAALSAPNSRLIATCIDRDGWQASLQLQASHYFAALWHFCMGHLDEPALASCGWRLTQPPATTAQLARQRYGADTYVALYGGAECVFAAQVLPGVASKGALGGAAVGVHDGAAGDATAGAEGSQRVLAGTAS